MRALTRSAVIAAGHSTATVAWRSQAVKATGTIDVLYGFPLILIVPKPIPFDRGSCCLIAEREK